jgi:DNA adenine methylase
LDSFISWIGGKRLLRKKIISMFPSNGFDKYIEVFGGAGWVLFGAEEHAEKEVYNDINGELVNLFRCVKYHCGELRRELSFLLNSRELFNDYKAQIGVSGMTDIQRAARYYMIIKLSYGSDRRTYGCCSKNLSKMMNYLEVVSARLERVIIENKTFDSILKTYDSNSALFYLDPPYHGTEKYYDNAFTDDDHARLKDLLNALKGRFLLSYNDDDFVRNLYKDYQIIEVTRQNNLLGRYDIKDKTFKELIIKNY